MKRIFTLISFCLCLQTFGQQFSQKFSNVNYVGDGQGYHNMDIYLPKVTKAKYPTIIMIYGSAWLSNSGKGADMTTVGAALLDAGFAVVTPNHRSSSDARYPAQINDIKAVARFLRGNADTYSLDTSFIGVSGSSSGGHLAALMGTTNGVTNYTVGTASANIEGTLGSFTSFSSDVDAVCDWFGPTDILVMSKCINGDGFDHDSQSSPGSAMVGGKIHDFPDRVALLNPITFVDARDAPFIIFHGDADKTVPYCQSELLDKALDKAGVPSDYTLIKGGQHGPGVQQAPYLGEMVDFFLGLLGGTVIVDPVVQTPFNGTPHLIPGKIQAEEYDLGGEGIGFHEANSNGNESGATFRNDQVDIEATQDVDGAYNIGYILNGEWLAYSVDVSMDGKYSLSLRVATQQDNKKMHIEMDGKNVSGNIAIPNTGGWQTWQTVVVNDINLTAGKHIMKLVFEADYFNLNYIEFKSGVTAIDKNSNSDLTYIFPSDNHFIMRTEGVSNYTIYSVNANVIESGICDQTCTFGHQLPAGLYFVKYENKDQIGTKKFIKN